MVLQLGSCISGEQRALGVLLYSAKYHARPSASKGSTSLIDFLMEEIPWVPQSAECPCMSISVSVWVGSALWTPAQQPFWNRAKALGMLSVPKHSCIPLAGHTSSCFSHYKLCGVFKARRDGLQAGQCWNGHPSLAHLPAGILVCHWRWLRSWVHTPWLWYQQTAMHSHGLSWWIYYVASLLRLSLYDEGFSHIANSIWKAAFKMQLLC